MQLIVDNLAVNYEKMGKGECILLLHGWGDDSRTFASLSARLSQRFLVITPDLPGFGGSEAPKTGWNLDNYSEFMAHFLSKLNIKQTRAVIGHSNGAALAVRALSTAKIKSDKLVILAGAGIRDSHKAKRALTKVIAKTGKTVAFWLPIEHKQKLRRKLYGTIGSDMLVVPAMEATYKLTVRQDVQADAAKLSLPTLLIYADGDPAVPLSDGQKFSQLINGSRLEAIHSKDHFIHHDQAEKVEKLIEGFI